MDNIRTLGRQSLQLFEQFIAGARSVITEEGLSAAGATAKIKEQQERLVHETREVLQTFRTKVTHKEQELKAILHPARQDLVEQAREALRKVYQIIEQLSMKDKMVHRWVEQSASALVADYQGALSDGDMTKIEVFESEAEQYLAEKGDLEATSKFLALRAESEDSQLSPDQKKAKADLTELERIKEQVAVVVALLASGAKAYGGLAPLDWRQEERYHLNHLDLLGVSVTLHREGYSPVPVSLTEISKGGLRVRASEKFFSGIVLTLSLKYPVVTEEAVSLNVEVEWCEQEQNEPGWYAVGLKIAEETGGSWLDLLPKIVEHFDAFQTILTSPFGTPP